MDKELQAEVWAFVKESRDMYMVVADHHERAQALLMKMHAAGLSDHLPTLEEVQAAWAADHLPPPPAGG